MEFIHAMDQRVRRLGIWDLKLVQCAAMCLALIVAKLVPEIMTVSVWWFVVLAVVCAIHPFYVFYVRA